MKDLKASLAASGARVETYKVDTIGLLCAEGESSDYLKAFTDRCVFGASEASAEKG
jgi:hypothetical protein